MIEIVEGTHRRWLIAIVAVVLAVAFVGTTLFSFFVSKNAMRESIINSELPLTTDSLYAEIQKDLIKPILVSQVMANDTFLRDWAVGGETDVGQISKYLSEISQKFGVFSAFFVSEKTHYYYYPGGILKMVHQSEWRDLWYYRVRDMTADHELNVDLDMANHDALTIFVNYRVFDYQHNFIGATGVGVTAAAVDDLIARYQHRFQRSIYFTDAHGKVVVAGRDGPRPGTDIHAADGLASVADAALMPGGGAFEYQRDGETHLLRVHFLPELNWYLFVERVQDEALTGIRHAVYANLAVAIVATAIVVVLLGLTISLFQGRIERVATTDKLTGLRNRQAQDILLQQAMRESGRSGRPLSVIIFDIDHFKLVNDRHGHLAGDQVLRGVAASTVASLRSADVVCRWGGEEFLAMLTNCDRGNALVLAEKIRANIEETVTPFNGGAVRVTVSLGVTQMQGGDNADKLLNRADKALYEAKRQGRNRAVAA